MHILNCCPTEDDMFHSLRDGNVLEIDSLDGKIRFVVQVINKLKGSQTVYFSGIREDIYQMVHGYVDLRNSSGGISLE